MVQYSKYAVKLLATVCTTAFSLVCGINPRNVDVVFYRHNPQNLPPKVTPQSYPQNPIDMPRGAG